MAFSRIWVGWGRVGWDRGGKLDGPVLYMEDSEQRAYLVQDAKADRA